MSAQLIKEDPFNETERLLDYLQSRRITPAQAVSIMKLAIEALAIGGEQGDPIWDKLIEIAIQEESHAS
jgi:hypothetical protein